MSFASFLKGGMSILFGHASDDTPKAETKHEPQLQPVIKTPNSLTLDDIQTLQNTLQQMAAITKTFGIAIYAYDQFQSPPALRANIESLLHDATDLSEKSTAAIANLDNKCETVRRNAIINGNIDEVALRPIVIDVVTCYNFMLGSCENHLKAITALQSIGPVIRADEIQTRFGTAIESGLLLYKDLTSILQKLRTNDAAPAAEAGTPSRQP